MHGKSMRYPRCHKYSAPNTFVNQVLGYGYHITRRDLSQYHTSIPNTKTLNVNSFTSIPNAKTPSVGV